MICPLLSVGFVLSTLNICSEAAFTVTGEEEANGSRWAVLLAGSYGYDNYRHQADICHAYQILHANGIPDSNIIVMMYDDIAYSQGNPMPGYIINRPDGPNVYEGVVKDYVGEDVTPQNFLNVLLGNKSALAGAGSGKVLNSGSNDRVFINMVDHGAPGIFGFPESILHARDFVNVLISLHLNRRFKEMVIYVESCESGSMFNRLLPDNINVYALSASSPTQPSYACYLDEFLDVYLGDLFSVSWMEDTDSEDIEKETLDTQFEIVFTETHFNETPSRYGDLFIEAEALSNFLGHPNAIKRHRPTTTGAHIHLEKLKQESLVESPDVPLYVLEQKLRKATTRKESDFYKREFIRLHKNRKFLANKVEEIVLRVTWNSDLTKTFMDISQTSDMFDWDCYERVVASFHSKCFNLGKNSYGLRFMGILSILCNEEYTAKQIETSIYEVCDFPSIVGII